MANNGWAKLGAALAGVSDSDRADIRAKTMNALAQTDYNVERAKGAIMKQRELERLGDTFGGMGIANAPDVANSVRAGVNLNQVYGGLEKNQKMGFRQSAMDAPDWDTANRAMLAAGPGSVDLAKVQGNTLINNSRQVGGGGVSATPLGESMIAENAAQAGLANTRGQAALITANRPRGAGGSAAAPKLDPVSKREFESADKLLNDRERALQVQLTAERSRPTPSARGPALAAELQRIQDDRQALYGKFRSQLGGDGLGSSFADAAGSEVGIIESETGQKLTQAQKAQIANGTFELKVPAPGGAPAVETKAGGYDFSAELPAKALDAVRSAGGKPVTFKNGSTWIFRDGQPTRVK